ANVWTHLAVIYNFGTGIATMYVNGQPVATAQSAGAYVDTYDLEIGRGRDGYLNGDLAEVVTYNRALTDAEFQQLHQYLTTKYTGAPAGGSTGGGGVVVTPTYPPAPPTGAMALWLKADSGLSLNGTQVTRWNDASGKNNNAVQPSGSNQPQSIKASNGKQVVRFNDTSSFLTVPNSSSLDFGASSYTVSYWINAPLSSGIGGHMRKGDSPFSLNGGGFEFRNQTNLIEFARGIRNGTPNRDQYRATANTWTHIAVIYSATTGTSTMYINGTLAASAQSTGAYTDYYDLEIGRGRDGYLNGDVSEIIIYSRALSDQEFQQLHQYLLGRNN
ncbi:MAG: LamG-like jellyroll fold domain-containing protein, partial [Bryobacteraceae bacterium]